MKNLKNNIGKILVGALVIMVIGVFTVKAINQSVAKSSTNVYFAGDKDAPVDPDFE